MTFLIAPTEPLPLRALGRTSSLPEKFGCDILTTARDRKIGVQRKEVKDLIASVSGGGTGGTRLMREIGQMKTCGLIPGRGLLIVEGKLRWSDGGHGGVLLNLGGFGQKWTRRQFEGLLWSVQEAGLWVTMTKDLAETVEVVKWWKDWCGKEHRSLTTRGGAPTNIWGERGEKEWGVWMLQGFQGIGSELAGRVWDEFGRVPLTMTGEDEERLRKVKGMGKKKVDGIRRVLEPRDEE